VPVSRRLFLQTALTAGGLALMPPEMVEAEARPFHTVRDRVAQLFVISFGGARPEGEIVELLRRERLGGVVLFARNCESPDQLRSLLQGLQQVSHSPLLVCTDQEGGSVVRIRNGVEVFPPEAEYGRRGSAPAVAAAARATGGQLHALGLTMNLAPVVDVLANPTSPIGDRSFGPDPQLDARLGVAAIRAYQRNGLAAVAKHFIGLGHTSIDTHESLPTVPLTLEELEASDLIPFRAAIRAGVASIMVAHVALPQVDPSRRPASVSAPVIQGLLRRHLGFEGLVMTDSLLMAALPQSGEAPAEALAAGADILLMGVNHDVPAAVFEDAIERVVAAVKSGRIPESRLDEALDRVLRLKGRFPPPSV
jgi:beta-N-acetylhexosaminidase